MATQTRRFLRYSCERGWLELERASQLRAADGGRRIRELIGEGAATLPEPPRDNLRSLGRISRAQSSLARRGRTAF